MAPSTLLPLIRTMLARHEGNFGILSALLMVPLMGAVGIAVDIASILEARNKVEQAADAAVLSSLSGDYKALLAGSMSKSSQRTAEEQMSRFFRSQLPPDVLGEAQVDFEPKRETDVQRVLSAARYRVTVPSTFLKVLGIPELSASGETEATTGLLPFSQIHVLVDNSPSMSVAATPADQDDLVQLTGCEHACHTVDKKYATVEQARQERIPLRLDLVRQAVASLGTVIERRRQVANQFVMNLYSLGKTAKDHYKSPVSILGTGMTSAAELGARASSVDVMWLNRFTDDRKATDMPAALQRMKTLIPRSGSGATAADPAQILLLITDGIAHDDKFVTCLGSNSHTICIEPIDPADCRDLKNKGIRVAVVRTPFTPMPNDNRYKAFVQAYLPQIVDNMQACASPDLYTEMRADADPNEILQGIFLKSVLMSRLTQ